MIPTRRTFLASLAALVAAPLVPKAAPKAEGYDEAVLGADRTAITFRGGRHAGRQQQQLDALQRYTNIEAQRVYTRSLMR